MGNNILDATMVTTASAVSRRGFLNGFLSCDTQIRGTKAVPWLPKRAQAPQLHPILFFMLTCVASLLSPIQVFGQGAYRNSTLLDDVRAKVGPLPQGGYMLSSGWRINAAGRNIPLGTLPMSHALSPDGRYLAVLSGG